MAKKGQSCAFWGSCPVQFLSGISCGHKYLPSFLSCLPAPSPSTSPLPTLKGYNEAILVYLSGSRFLLAGIHM